MNGAVVEIPTQGWEIQRKLGLPKCIREAVKDHLHQRWPYRTAQMASHHYKMTLDRAREAAAGRCSLSTFEAIIQRGGLAVALPIVEAVTGQSVAQHLREMRQAHEDHGRRLASLWGDPPGRAGFDRRGAAGVDRLGADGDDASGGGVGGQAASTPLNARGRGARQ